MLTVHFDSSLCDDDRRRRLYAGDLFAFPPGRKSLGLCNLAKKLSEEAFAPHHPEIAQNSMSAEQYSSILAALKPRFIHHPRAKELIGEILEELGCRVETTFFDVPRLRTMAHSGYMNAGLALQFHPHRDTWFSAPQAQLNWWLPVYDIVPENSMAIHPRYFTHAVKNTSSDYDYKEWNRTGRRQAAQQIKEEQRKQPKAEEDLDLEPDVRVVMPVGSILIFSAAHMHSTVPNTTQQTRFSIDFRTVNLEDLADGRGAPNVDSECTGTTLCDFLRADNLSPLPCQIVARYEKCSQRTNLLGAIAGCEAAE